MASNPTVDVQQYGQSLWLDFISRHALDSGELRQYIEQFGVIGVTSNPAIFQKAIGESDDYDGAMLHLLDLDTYAIYERLAVEDIRRALDLFAPVYARTARRDGYVSLEVSPLIANDTQTTIAEAKRLFKLIDRPNLMIKIPATPAGIPAIEEAIASGVNVNVTLIFAVQNYEEVARAYIRGLERRLAAGEDVRHVASVASFFLSRIDTLIDRMLEDNIQAAEGHDPARAAANRELLGKAAIANAKLAYKRFMDMFYGDAFAQLRAAGAQVQRPLWASTGTKNPAYPDTLYVDKLIGKDTVNTVPPATLKAFRDHGQVGDMLLDNLDDAERLLDMLAEVGVDMDQVTRQLQLDGVELFSDAFRNLLAQVEGKHNVLAAGVIQRQQTALGDYAGAVSDALKKLEAERVNPRLWAHDGKVWKDDPATVAKIENRLGWLDTLRTIDLARLKALQAGVRGSDIRHVVLLGMGGSSLAPEVLYQTFGQQPGFPAFLMLDSTDPAAIRAVEAAVDLKHTLFIVSSKSGGTIETSCFFRYFYERTGGSGAQFSAITDPDTSLDKLAQEKAFRDIFRNPADIGGRYSALSYFGLVPAALMGLDLDRLWREAERMMTAGAANVPARLHPGLTLGAIMAVLGQRGRDKVVIQCSSSLASLGAWVEQLIAESTGKEGRGLLPVVGGSLGAPHDYSADTLVVVVRVEGSPDNAQTDAAIQALQDAGIPCVTLHLADTYTLGGEFFRWEYATAIAGRVLGINPFDEPNVTESKNNTSRLLQYVQEHGQLPTSQPARTEGSARLYADEKLVSLLNDLSRQFNFDGSTLTGLLAALLNATRDGDYLALLAYVPMTEAAQTALEVARRRLQQATRRAVTVGYGPRFLHSTGQLHKGGPNNGIFIQITMDDPADLPIPGEPFTFGTLKAAQAAGDLEALQSKDRRVVRLHLTDLQAGIDLLLAAIDRVK